MVTRKKTALEKELIDTRELWQARIHEHERLKAVSRSMIVRIVTYLNQPTAKHLYAVHQIVRNAEELIGDVGFN